MKFIGRDVLSAKDFTREEVDYIIQKAQDIAADIAQPTPRYRDILKGKVLAALFFEPSTRTRLSFETAMLKLGGGVTGFASSEVSSIRKGETLADTIRTVSSYADVLVMRHDKEGAQRLAAQNASIPVINAGSGAGEHPTQAMLDLLTIKAELGKIDGLTIGLVGDLKYGRTVHSLAYFLSQYDVNLYFISPTTLAMQNRVLESLTMKRVKFKQTNVLQKTIPELDVLYMTRIQKERFVDTEEFQRVKSAFVLTAEDLVNAREKMIVLHPLPRVDEINPNVDSTKHARYFQQVRYGLYLRMALLALILGGLK
ncbi:MAG: aspartate carbamoyltransferase [Promethearchaeota archaeon CR_4]|nr:MAG: aspartate carbamoyltransferase [Candidatus Lokiarchaeota archaeon CR_4]